MYVLTICKFTISDKLTCGKHGKLIECVHKYSCQQQKDTNNNLYQLNTRVNITKDRASKSLLSTMPTRKFLIH